MPKWEDSHEDESDWGVDGRKLVPKAVFKLDRLHVEHEAGEAVERKVQRNRLLADLECYGDNVDGLLGCGEARQINNSVELLGEMGVEGLREGVHDLD